MTLDTMKVRLKAAELIENSGWFKANGPDTEDRYCLVTACLHHQGRGQYDWPMPDAIVRELGFTGVIEAAKWNDSQDGPEPVLALLRGERAL
jgi:hypothetical protein